MHKAKTRKEEFSGKTRKMAIMAIFTTIALIIFVIEAQIPTPIPVPGVKLGLANIVTLVAVYVLGRREAGIILLMRVLLGCLFAGSPSTLLFSAAGGLLAYVIMCLLYPLFSEDQMWIISAIAAIGHNAGQLAMCAFVVKTPGILAYAPILAASGVITGVFTGIAAKALIQALRKVQPNLQKTVKTPELKSDEQKSNDTKKEGY